MRDMEMREAIRALMAAHRAMELKRQGAVIPGVTDSPLVRYIESLTPEGR